ncbi:MAG: NADP-dependent phosphogluconate dehydrogenase [Ardenticatenia bacterium]|nr:NADP-dependent phosphogluconate dehydrogenase [Ardenticatenia bacterium]
MASIGVIGLGVMGQNLARNIARRGFRVAVYNRTREKTETFVQQHPDPNILATYALEELTAHLERPRRLLLMVKAGAAVDALIAQVRPLLEPGDVLIDGGNSHFTDTERRQRELASDGILMLGMGISGGEEGALRGPSLMPGGPKEAYEMVAPVLEAIAARAHDGRPCVAYLGPGGAGHYVKMVHNGIEYALMQGIAEAYDLLRQVGGLDVDHLAAIFEEWNRAELASFLVEITAHILRVQDPQTGRPLVDLVLDRAHQKGTGKWTSQNALDVGVPVPTITSAVEARYLSALKEERVRASAALPGPAPEPPGGLHMIDQARAALFANMVVAYAQGMALLRRATAEYGYTYRLADVAAIWRAGCIIRAALLEDIRQAFDQAPELPNVLLAPVLRHALAERQQGWRATLIAGVHHGVPMPATAAALAYYDGYRSARLPANLIQAQRDYFGAHTYERVDRPGTFHTTWRPDVTM